MPNRPVYEVWENCQISTRHRTRGTAVARARALPEYRSVPENCRDRFTAPTKVSPMVIVLFFDGRQYTRSKIWDTAGDYPDPTQPAQTDLM